MRRLKSPFARFRVIAFSGFDLPFFLVSILWAMGWTGLEIMRYSRGFATVFDLGSTAQSLYLISHGHWLAYNTFLGMPTLLDIDGYVLYILAWPFRFLGGPLFLYALQSLALVIFARAAYGYIFYCSRTRWMAWAFGLLALISPALIGGLMFDFHVDFVALLGLSLALMASSRGNKWLFYSGIALALLSKNVVALPVGVWAAIELVDRHYFSRKVWASVLLMATGMFVFDELILPHIFSSSGPSHLGLFSQYGSSASAILRSLFTHPAIIAHAVVGHSFYLVKMAGPWGFLPLVSGLYLLPFMTLVVLNDLAKDPALRSLSTQYSVVVMFFALLATGHSMTERSRRPLLWATSALVGTLSAIFFLKGIWTGQVKPQIGPNPSIAKVRQLARVVNDQPNAAVWTTNHLGVWVYAHRLIIADPFKSIQVLWKLRQKYAPESPVLLFMPRGDYNLDVNATVWQALTHQYKVLRCNNSAVVLSGYDRFPAYPQFAYASATAENAFTPVWPEYFPALLSSTVGHVNSAGWLTGDRAGVLSTGVPTAVPPGTYQLQFVFSNGASQHESIGVVRLLTAQGEHILVSGEILSAHDMTLTWTNPKNQWVFPEVALTGRSPLSYFGVIMRKE